MRVAVALIVLAAVVGFAGCGGDDLEFPGKAAPTSTPGATDTPGAATPTPTP